MTRVFMTTDFDGYLKDKETGIIINTNHADYERFVQQKNQYKEYLQTKEDIANLQQEMLEMKRLLLEKAKNV